MPTNTQGTPVLLPPQFGTSSSVDVAGSSAPTAVTDGQIASLVGEAVPAARPELAPPGAVGAEKQGVTATWRTSVTIDALWSIDETRNAHVRIVGIGWKKIFNGRDGAFQALVTLASQARQTGRPVNVREEADGMIYEIYLW